MRPRTICLVFLIFSLSLVFIPSGIVRGADLTEVESILGLKGQTQEGATIFQVSRSDIGHLTSPATAWKKRFSSNTAGREQL
jgi:hypothetical protein